MNSYGSLVARPGFPKLELCLRQRAAQLLQLSENISIPEHSLLIVFKKTIWQFLVSFPYEEIGFGRILAIFAMKKMGLAQLLRFPQGTCRV